MGRLTWDRFKSMHLCLIIAACVSALLPVSAHAGEYNLTIEKRDVLIDGRTFTPLTINGQVPGPTLHFKEGEDVTIHVTNKLDEVTSLHWHGFILPPEMDGVPGLNGFEGIKPGETFTYRFPIRQSGTYWYHSHSGTQEQAGLYGAIVIDPREPVSSAERDYVIVLSDFTEEDSDHILANLKTFPGYYNNGKRTIADFFKDTSDKGVGPTIKDRLKWGEMRMDPTDLTDVAHYTFLVNGKSANDNWTGLFTPGQKVRLRFINASSMSYFDVRIPELKMMVVAADGNNVQPVPVDEFRISVAETYDVIVTPKDNKAYTIFAEPIDRSGFARATLATRNGMVGEIPDLKPRATLTMMDMGMMHMGGTDHAAMGHNMAGMDHTAMMAENSVDGDIKNTAAGWADAATPKGKKALSYKDLKSLSPQKDTREAEREIIVRLGGNMERFIWTINGKKFDEADPVNLRYGERVKLTFINETMMAHPMHLHGMFVQLINGQPAERLPTKHVVNVSPGQSYSVMLTADEIGEWAFHCHMLYHMQAGMMTKVVVARLTSETTRAHHHE